MNETINHNLTLLDDEYINETNGLIYCSTCHMPRQKEYHLNGTTFMPRILCRCEQERLNNEKMRFQRREEFYDIYRLKATGLNDKSLLKASFNNADDYNSTAKAHALSYVQKWDAMNSAGTGLLLWGRVGTGKTYLAACIANALLDQGVSVFMNNITTLLYQMTNIACDKNELMNELNQYDLLIIDDLGVERNTDYSMELLFHLFDSRYRSKKPLIVTTNLTIDDFVDDADIQHSRIYNRLLETCIPVHVEGPNIREEIARANIYAAKNDS